MGKKNKGRDSNGQAEKERILKLLETNFDVMAYNLVEIEGMSRQIIEHKLNVKEAKPIN